MAPSRTASRHLRRTLAHNLGGYQAVQEEDLRHRMVPVDLHHGDCLRMAEWIEPASVNLVVTSPPYAMMRADKYGGIEPDKYPEWWMKVMYAVDYVLAPGGSFVVNWQAGRDGYGHKQTWDIRAQLMMIDSNRWSLCDEYCWDKQNPMPGRYKFAFTSGWERVLHLTRYGEHPHTWNDSEVKVQRVCIERSPRPQEEDTPSRNAANRKLLNERAKTTTSAPTNVIRSGNGTRSSTTASCSHPAIFPPSLPRFFIRLLSNPGDVVLDPFAGSGTTLHVALEEGRRAIGVELNDEYFTFLEKRFSTVQTNMFAPV